VAGTAGFALLFTAIRWWPKVVAGLRNRPALSRTALGAFFGPFLGVSLSLFAVQRTETGVAATIMSIVPVLIIAPAVLVFRERVSLRAIAGAVLAVAGVALLFL
jgi:drug/metabolite transporter (DMT)-like permease